MNEREWKRAGKNKLTKAKERLNKLYEEWKNKQNSKQKKDNETDKTKVRHDNRENEWKTQWKKDQ